MSGSTFVSAIFRKHGAGLGWAATAALTLSASAGLASTTVGDYGSKVVSFAQGTGLPPNYFNNASAALGAPGPVTGVGTPYPNVVDPFSPGFGKNDIVELGKAGQITLQLTKAFNVVNAPQLGVISNVGLIDASYPSGHTAKTATVFGGGVVDVRVSSNGSYWKDLGNVTFNLPGTAWSKLASPYEAAPTKADVAANFGLPFTGKVASFNNETFPQILKTLNGSVGGTWLNLEATTLKTIDYVQFRNPLGNPWTPTNPVRFALDAVTVSTVAPPSVAKDLPGGGSTGLSSPSGGGAGSAVPLPSAAPIGLAMLLAGGIWQVIRRRFAR